MTRIVITAAAVLMLVGLVVTLLDDTGRAPDVEPILLEGGDDPAPLSSAAERRQRHAGAARDAVPGARLVSLRAAGTGGLWVATLRRGARIFTVRLDSGTRVVAVRRERSRDRGSRRREADDGARDDDGRARTPDDHDDDGRAAPAPDADDDRGGSGGASDDDNDAAAVPAPPAPAPAPPPTPPIEDDNDDDEGDDDEGDDDDGEDDEGEGDDHD